MKEINTKQYLSVLRTMLRDGDKVCLNISGSSMAPFLIHERDAVCLLKPVKPLKAGDIVLYERPNGQFVLHRICQIRGDRYFLAGDAQTILEGPVDRKQIFGIVTDVCRNHQWFGPEDRRWIFFAGIWRLMRPFRPLLSSAYTEYLFIKRRFAR